MKSEAEDVQYWREVLQQVAECGFLCEGGLTLRGGGEEVAYGRGHVLVALESTEKFDSFFFWPDTSKCP